MTLHDIMVTSPDYTWPTSVPPTGWLVDVTGSYTATFLLSGAALLASSLVISIGTGIRRSRLNGRHKPLPFSRPYWSSCFHKEVHRQEVAS